MFGNCSHSKDLGHPSHLHLRVTYDELHTLRIVATPKAMTTGRSREILGEKKGGRITMILIPQMTTIQS
jgi:hypothetical protein